MKTRPLYIFVVLIVAGALAQAQQPSPEAQLQAEGNLDAFARNFYPPELIMQKQEALLLTGEQLAYFKVELRKAQLNFTELQWKLQDESERLLILAKAQHPNEEAILTQLGRVLDAERDVKK